MANILTLDELATANQAAQVYVVYNNTDYRMSLKTLLSLVTKTSLGLDKVNNTPDNEKPVSQMMLEALNEKANVDEVVDKATFEALVKTLSGFITLEQLNLAIKTVTDSLSGYVTKEGLTAAVGEAMATITAAVETLTKNVETNTSAITGIQDTIKTMVVEKTLTDAISTLRDELIKAISDQTTSFNDVITQLSQKLDLLNQSMTSLQQAIDTKAEKEHKHLPTDIEGLEDYVKNLVGTATGEITIGSTDW